MVVDDQPIPICNKTTGRLARLPVEAKIIPAFREVYLARNTFIINAIDGRDNLALRAWVAEIGGEAWVKHLRNMILRGVTYNHCGEVKVRVHVQLPRHQQGSRVYHARPATATVMGFTYPNVRDFYLYDFAQSLGCPLSLDALTDWTTRTKSAKKTAQTAFEQISKTRAGVTGRGLELAATRFRIVLEGLEPLVVRVGSGDFAVPAAYARKMRLI